MDLRDNQESRNRLCELICVLTLSPKTKMIKFKKIEKKHLTIDFIKSYTKAINLFPNNINYFENRSLC